MFFLIVSPFFNFSLVFGSKKKKEEVEDKEKEKENNNNPPTEEKEKQPEQQQPKKFGFIKKGKSNANQNPPVNVNPPQQLAEDEHTHKQETFYITETEEKEKEKPKSKAFGFIKKGGANKNKETENKSSNLVNSETHSTTQVNTVNNNFGDIPEVPAPKSDLDALNSLFSNEEFGLTPSNREITDAYNEVNIKNQESKISEVADKKEEESNLEGMQNNNNKEIEIYSDVISYTSENKNNIKSINNDPSAQTEEQQPTPKKFGFIKKKNPNTNQSKVTENSDLKKAVSTTSSEIKPKKRTEEVEESDTKSIKTTSNYEAEKTLIKNLTPYNNNTEEEVDKKKKNFIREDDSKKSTMKSTSIGFRKGSENLRTDCREEVLKNKYQLHEIFIEMSLLKKDIFEINNELNKIKLEKDSLNLQSSQAIEEEDYERAGIIEESIEKLKIKEKDIKEKLQEKNETLISIRERELINYSMTSKAYVEVKNSFESLKETMKKEMDIFKTKDLSKHKNDQFKIKKMKEKLDNMQQNLELDKESLKLEEEKIDNLIKSQSIDVFNELDSLNQQKEKALVEIEELKKQLEEKYNFVDGLNVEIESKENEIDAIKSNFKPEFKKLNTKRKNVDEGQKDFEEQSQQLNEMENDYAKNQDINNKKEEEITRKINVYTDEIKKYDDYSSKNTQQMQKMQENFKEENELNSKLYLIELDYQQSFAKLENTKNEITLLELNNKKLDSDIIGLELKIPALEEEKVKFVTSKNFKEAGRVSSELKKIAENKSLIQKKIVENNENILLLQEKNKKIIENNQSTKDEIEEIKVKILGVKYQGLLMLKDSYTNLINFSFEKGERNESLFTELEKYGINCKNISEVNELLTSGLNQIEYEISELEENEYIKTEFIEKARLEAEAIQNEIKVKESEAERIQNEKTKEENENTIIANDVKILKVEEKEAGKIIYLLHYYSNRYFNRK